MRRVLSKSKEEEAVKRYLEDENISVTSLAKEFGINRNTLSRILKKNGIQIRIVRHLSEEDKKEIVRRYFEGNISISRLAREYGVNLSSVQGVLKKAGRKVFIEDTIKSQADQIVKEYLDNEVTHAELAQKYKCTRSSITHIINKAEISDSKYQKKRKDFDKRKKTIKRKLRVTPEELIAERERTKMSYSKLAKQYQVSESCIYHAITRHRKK